MSIPSSPKRVAMTAQQFLAGSLLRPVELAGMRTEDGEIPVVYVKLAKAADVLALAEFADDKTPEGKAALQQAQYAMVARSIYDENGNRLLTDEQAPELANMPATGFLAILDEVTGDMSKLKRKGGTEGNA